MTNGTVGALSGGESSHDLDFPGAVEEEAMEKKIAADPVSYKGGAAFVEGPGFNVFAINDGEIFTPDRGVLEGVTRRTAIELSSELGIPLQARKVPAGDVREADEVFITSTAGGVMPVTRVDGVPIGEGTPGPITLLLREAYWELHRDPRFATPVEYA
jgi:branched-chain amino acid aminotransferase